MADSSGSVPAGSSSPYMPKRLEPHEYLALQSEYWATYHHHKEQMAFAAAALYLTGATALTFLDLSDLFTHHFLAWCWLLFLLAVTGIAGIAFVFWQLRHREHAAHMVRACASLSTTWLTEPPKEDDLKSRDDSPGHRVTRALDTAYNQAKKSYAWHQSPAFATWITTIVMLLWGITIIVRALYLGLVTGAQETGIIIA